MDNNSLKCAMDHILDAQQKGEINEDNVLYIVENINVAGNFLACPSLSAILYFICSENVHTLLERDQQIWVFWCCSIPNYGINKIELKWFAKDGPSPELGHCDPLTEGEGAPLLPK